MLTKRPGWLVLILYKFLLVSKAACTSLPNEERIRAKFRGIEIRCGREPWNTEQEIWAVHRKAVSGQAYPF
jgi:hypothetical protein